MLVVTSSIDPVKGTLGLRVDIRPRGAFLARDGVSLTTPVNVDVFADLGTANYRYQRGDRIPPIDVTVGLDSGDVNAYPFDSYSSNVVIKVAIPHHPGPTPTLISLEGSLGGFTVASMKAPTDAAAPDEHSFELTVHRAPVTGAFAILILVLLVLLALIAISITVHAWRRVRRGEIPMVTSLAAMLFATITLRGAMPGAPPIGALIDVAVFFWVVAAIAVCLGAVVLLWNRTTPER